MNFLKALVNILLGFLLFLCLTVIGFGLTLDTTILSSRFVTHKIAEMNVSGAVNEVLIPAMQKDPELSKYPGFIHSFQVAVGNHEIEIKQAANTLVTGVYGYVINGRPLDLTATLKKSLLDPGLAQGVIADLDLSPVVESLVPQVIPPDFSFNLLGTQFTISLTPYREKLTPVVQTWFKQHLIESVPVLYGYLLGETSNADLNYSTDTLTNAVYPVLRQAFLDSPPPQAAGLSRDIVGLLFDAGWAVYSPQTPTYLNIDLGENTDAPAQLRQAIASVQSGVDAARRYLRYYQIGFALAVGMALVLVLAICLINRGFKTSGRILGETLVAYGVFEIAGIIVAWRFLHSAATTWDVAPASLQPWLLGLSESALHAAVIFPIICAVLGIVLLVTAFTGRQAETAD